MITVICTTNRPKNQTIKIVQKYVELLDNKGVENKMLSMESLPADFIINDSYGNRTEEFERLIDEYLTPAEKLVIISPEYNGSYPGVFKAFIDALEYRSLRGKKAALVGLASGRGGNALGMAHLTDVLHNAQIEVMHNRLPISSVYNLVDKDKALIDEATIEALDKHCDQLLAF